MVGGVGIEREPICDGNPVVDEAKWTTDQRVGRQLADHDVLLLPLERSSVMNATVGHNPTNLAGRRAYSE
jgi:hypothetical protein